MDDPDDFDESNFDETDSDPFDLGRFLAAQDGVYPAALAEVSAGRKRTHWMWFVFPQLRGLGSSQMARRYGVGGTAEAAAYLRHPVLGPRLREIAAAANGLAESDPAAVFGSPDDMKLRSCLTLFAIAAERCGEDGGVFAAGLAKFFAGQQDERTLAMIDSADG